ncbi:MAG: toprim domain-containing protein, partial [Gemmatimonadota bacterium]|nr:toprim domain-containing protein [Gemmatimonadota bacterium]
AAGGRVLVVVESPAKCRTIQKYSGRRRSCKRASVTSGTCPPRASAAAPREELPGLDPESGWAARWEVLEGKRDTVARLKKLARPMRGVVMPTDQNREGEAIAWHLCELLAGKALPMCGRRRKHGTHR